jgi:hypothetical protein
MNVEPKRRHRAPLLDRRGTDGGLGIVRSTRVVVAVLALIASSMAAPVVASADPDNGNSIENTFFDCTGPVGTPETFTGTKIPGPGVSLQLSDGTQVYVAMRTTDLVTGLTWYDTPGLAHNGLPTITCHVIGGITGHLIETTGYVTPAQP